MPNAKVYAVPEHQFGAELAKSLEQEIKDQAGPIAATLFGRKPPDTTVMSRADYLALLTRNWTSQDFRVKALQNVGPNQFIADAIEAGLYADGQYDTMNNMAEALGMTPAQQNGAS